MEDNKATEHLGLSGLSGTISTINTGTTGVSTINTGTTTHTPLISTIGANTPDNTNFQDYLDNYSQGIIYNDSISNGGSISTAQISYTDKDIQQLRHSHQWHTILQDYAEMIIANLRLRGLLQTELEVAPQLAWDNQVNNAAYKLAGSIAAAWGHGYPAFKSVRVFSDGTFEIIAII